MYYLLKTEPTVYGFADLQKEQSTIWDGVTNPVAVKNLRGMSKGDKLVIYHTGDQKSAVGTATVESVDAADPKVPKVKIKAGKLISHPVTLAEIKTSELFEGSALVRQGRLSVVPLSKEQYDWLTGKITRLARSGHHSYRTLFWSNSALPSIACVVFFCIAYLSLSTIESYWLTALLATPPAAGVLTLWVIRSRQLDRWVCPQCRQVLAQTFRIATLLPS